MKICLTIEYDGEPYLGWQVQPQGSTIQGELERAIEKVIGQSVFVRGAGRTDAGVHARGQVASFEAPETIPPEKWREAINCYLPSTIRVLASERREESFDALKSAVSKIYEYRVANRAVASALDRRVYFYPGPLDWARMQECLSFFVGAHDFACFQGSGSNVKTTVRTIHRFELEEQKDGLYRFEIEGSGFLKQMVRAIIGTVFEVGEGKRSLASIPEMILSKDRKQGGRTAPASGLCLVKVKYEN